MKQNETFPNEYQKPPEVIPPSKMADPNQGDGVDGPSPGAAAEARLFGGIERETQMHPGSSLFVTEH